GDGFQLHIGHNKPESRGSVRVQSADSKRAPRIRFNYLAHEADRYGFRDCVPLTRQSINQPAMDDYRGAEIQRGGDGQSDEQIGACVRQAVASAYHPSCSCKMGIDELAVVDPHTRVHGIENLRVVDSSIFPTIPSGNLNSPTIMVAERAADLIRGKEPLQPSGAPVTMDDQWQARQRPGHAKRVLI